MSDNLVTRLRAAIAASKGVSIELPKAFVHQIIEALLQPINPDLDALVKKQKQWNATVVSEWLKSALVIMEHEANPPRNRTATYRTQCRQCEGDMMVLETRGNRRRLKCTHCKRRVTSIATDQPTKA